MKLDRLLAITIILINRNRVQAKELAEMFGVSVRTIYRDVEAINQAGIPVVAFRGANGGIGVVDGYRLHGNVLTSDELASIFSALKSVSSSLDDSSARAVLEKIKGLVPKSREESFKAKTEQVFIDFSPWGTDFWLAEKMDKLRGAIQACLLVSFTYCSARGDVTARTVEPHTLVLKEQKWYLYAFCALRNGFRLFKLTRIKDLKVLDAGFRRREINLEELPWDKGWDAPQNLVKLVLRFDAGMRILAEDWFGVENVRPDEAGGCIVEAVLPEDEWLCGFILSFGHRVEVLEPEGLRLKTKEIAARICGIY